MSQVKSVSSRMDEKISEVEEILEEMDETFGMSLLNGDLEHVVLFLQYWNAWNPYIDTIR